MHAKANLLRRLLIPANPRRFRPGEGRVLQAINSVHCRFRRNRHRQLPNRAAPNLREERIQLEFDRFRRKHVFQNAVLARQQLQERQVRIVAHPKDVRLWPARFGQPFPVRFVRRREFRVFDEALSRAAVTQQH